MATLIKQWLNGSPLHLILRESLCFTHLGPVQTPLHSCAELTEVLSTAKERRLNQFGTAKTLSLTGSVALFDIGATGDSNGDLLMCRIKCIHYDNL